MRVTEISLFPLRIPLFAPFVISLGPLTHAENLFIRIRTDDGCEGWGEASPFPTIHGETLESCTVVTRLMATKLLGFPVVTAPASPALMNRLLYGNFAAKSALEIALCDLAAQQAGLPLYRYLGGQERRELFTDYTVSLGPVEKMVTDAKRIVARGFPVVKVKLGENADADLHRIELISRAVGPKVPLRLDANQGWSQEDAARVLSGIGQHNIQHCEAPIDRREWTRLPELRRISQVPLMADESCWDDHDARRLLEIMAVDRINIKLSKAGGLHTARKIIDTTNVPLQVGGFLESRLGFTAAAHLAMSNERVEFCDFDTPLMQTDDPVEGGLRYGAAGLVTLDDGPGLGARLRPEYQLPSCEQIVIK